MSDTATHGEEIHEKASSEPQERGEASGISRDTPEEKNAQDAIPARSVYVVQKGDKLWNIAKKYLGAGARCGEIMKINGLDSPRVRAGDRILLPCASLLVEDPTAAEAPKTPAITWPESYTVKPGDTIWSISRDVLGNYRRFEEIKRINGLVTSAVYPGQVLKLPRI